MVGNIGLISIFPKRVLCSSNLLRYFIDCGGEWSPNCVQLLCTWSEFLFPRINGHNDDTTQEDRIPLKSR